MGLLSREGRWEDWGMKERCFHIEITGKQVGKSSLSLRYGKYRL